MNDNKYIILWLDDQSQTEQINRAKREFPNVEIVYVPFIDKCAEELDNNSHRYDAVIFDANNHKSDNPGSPKTANKKGFVHLIKDTLKKKIPVYIYSGELDPEIEGDEADNTLDVLFDLGLRPGENIFNKNKPLGELIEKVLDDFHDNNHLYIGNEYLLSFFKNRWIDKKDKSAQLDPIMKYYNDHNIDFAYGNQMRILVEQMLEKINSILPCTEKKEDRASKIIDGLKSQYKRYVIAMIGALKHMDEMPNELSHNTLDEEERELHFNSDYSTFFLVAHWFYKLMQQFEKEGILPLQEKIKEPHEASLPSKKTSPLNHPKPESNYDGLYEYPFEENGVKYVKLKVKVLYGNDELKRKEGAVLVTGIQIDKYNPQKWITRPVNDVRIIEEEPKSTGFKLSDTAIFKKWKK